MQCHCVCSKLLYHFLRNPSKISTAIWSVTMSSWPCKWDGQAVSSRLSLMRITSSSSSRKWYNYVPDTKRRLKSCLQALSKTYWSNCGECMSWSRVYGRRVCLCVLPQGTACAKSDQPKRLWCFTIRTGVRLHHLTKKLDGSLLHTVLQRLCRFIHSTASEFKPQKTIKLVCNQNNHSVSKR